MVALKHVLLASLVTLAVASPASNQWQKPGTADTGVAQHGKPNGAPQSGAAGSHEQGGWQQSTKGKNEKDEDNKSSGKEDDADKQKQHQPRDEPTISRYQAFAKGKGDDASKGRPLSKDAEGNSQKHHQARDEDAMSKHQVFAEGKGDDASKAKPSDEHGEHNSQKHHQARDDAPNSKSWKSANHMDNDALKDKSISLDDDGNESHKHHQTRDAYIDEAFHKSILAQLRNVTKEGNDKQTRDVAHDHSHGTEHASHDDYETHPNGEHDEGKNLHARAQAEKGIYECWHKNWVAPCTWTPLADGVCYNRLYTAENQGSMGPDKGLCCTMYEVGDCNTKGWHSVPGFVWPGIADYQESNVLYNNAMSDDGPMSVMCKTSEKCP